MFHYRAYGLTIESEIEIPEFLPLTGEEPVDLQIRQGKIPLSPLKKLRFRDISRSGMGTIFHWKKKGTFLLKEGRFLIVDPHRDSRDTNMVNALLIGPVMGNLAMQREDRTVFHCAVMGNPDGKSAVGIMAQSGQGKSTTATALLDRGFSLVSDDLLVLDKKDYTTVYPGYPGMKLWDRTVKQFVPDGEELPILGKAGVYEKKFRSLTDSFAKVPMPLKAIFLLKFDDDIVDPVAVRLSEKEALLQLQPHWYGSLFSGDLLPIFGKERLFSECASLARTVPLYTLTRPYDMDRLQESNDQILSIIK